MSGIAAARAGLRHLLLACLLVLTPLFAGVAHAAQGTVVATEMQGFGRIVFTFDQEVVTKVRIVNAVMIVEFDKVVALDLEKIAAQVPNYISVARLDPDGKSVRFGMSNRFRADAKSAGEFVYLDMLPPRWQGLPPSLPAEVVQELAKRARVAEDRLKRIDRDKERRVSRELDLRVGSTPLFRRAIFTMPKTVPVEFEDKDGVVALTFDSNFEIKPELIRARLAGLVRNVQVEADETALRVSMRPVEGLVVRGFREDDSFTLDFSRADGQPVELAEPAPPPAQKQGMAAPSAVPAAPLAATMPAARAVIQAGSTPEPPIDASFEPGKDPAGFALRLSNLGRAPVAIVPRGNMLLVVIETPELPSLPTIPAALKHNVEGVSISRIRDGAMLQIVPRSEGAFWLSRSGDDLLIQRGRSEISPEAIAGSAIALKRAYDASGREALEASLGNLGRLFAVDDPVSGQRLHVVPVPDVAYSNDKAREFVEFSIERTLSGFAVLPLDEAVTLTRTADGVLIGHEIKLNLSALPPAPTAAARGQKALLIEPEKWDREAKGGIRANERLLLQAAAEAPRVNRSEARLKLARFYLAKELYPEAEGVLNVIAADDQAAAQSKSVLFHRALTATLMRRTVEARRLLSEPALSIENEHALLQAATDAGALRYAQAVAGFKQATEELDRYPEALQAKFRRMAIESAIEASDPAFGREQLKAFEKLDSTVRDTFLQQLLAARLAEMQGRHADAHAAYLQAAKSPDRDIEAEARFGAATSGLADGKLSREDAKAEFETLSTIWRRSEVEIKALARLGEIYAEDGRWREAFLASQRGSAVMPDHPVARRMEEAMGRRFERLSLDGEADKLSKVEALALYQEFRTLIPPGRRGDEIVRRLADRLHDLDLTSEAAEILEYQVRKRLDGVARAAVAARLALMHLQNREPLRALTILRDTRLANVPNDLRRARGVLEARALGDLFRSELAIEVLANEDGEDIDRLRADIYWKGKKWREAGERYERVLGDSWQTAEPLTDGQRLDAMRAGLAYVLADEKLSLDRLRSKFLTKMSKSEDAGAFNLITIENFSNPAAFREIARTVVNADTMTEFLSSYRKRYPESGGANRPARSAQDPARQSSLPRPAPGSG